MNFTESEVATFWPVYKEYASAQQAIAAKRWSLIVDYAENIDKMDDQKAKDLSQCMFAIDDEIQSLPSKNKSEDVHPTSGVRFATRAVDHYWNR